VVDPDRARRRVSGLTAWVAGAAVAATGVLVAVDAHLTPGHHRAPSGSTGGTTAPAAGGTASSGADPSGAASSGGSSGAAGGTPPNTGSFGGSASSGSPFGSGASSVPTPTQQAPQVSTGQT
jgi:hypothetical protein